jgi:hypothetical protein
MLCVCSMQITELRLRESIDTLDTNHNGKASLHKVKNAVSLFAECTSKMHLTECRVHE